ncbi:MAG: hypothetical protein DCC57_12740 [Chloroflexi bacterium]|nr:MAG: hypothetical protein DCC57_12740 [Chloroflexota bacterium]
MPLITVPIEVGARHVPVEVEVAAQAPRALVETPAAIVQKLIAPRRAARFADAAVLQVVLPAA